MRYLEVKLCFSYKKKARGKGNNTRWNDLRTIIVRKYRSAEVVAQPLVPVMNPSTAAHSISSITSPHQTPFHWGSSVLLAMMENKACSLR